ncbi:shootin-1 [Atheta coriaria]|uniref:shootin-1 n=1 Tax=Dalotia coriaria TaxID=877792 RepID=UPI0031F3AA0B
MSIQDVGIVNNPNEENQPDVEHFQYGDNVTDISDEMATERLPLSPTAKFYVNTTTPITNGTNGHTPRIDDPPNRWKIKYEDSEERRKKLLTENEKTKRALEDSERKCIQLRCKNEEQETELFEKNESLAKLTTASKGLFKEYDALKHKYEAETNAMRGALTDASHWYKENKALRRRTLLLQDADAVDEGVDACEPTASDGADLDNLRESVRALSTEVAQLQAELNAAKLAEFEASEHGAQQSHDLEEERRRNDRLQSELRDLTQSHEQLMRVSGMMQRELEELKRMAASHQSNAEALRKEADGYRKERNVLAHQSTILLEGVDDVGQLLLAQEVEELKSTLEEERASHQLELEALQERCADKERDAQVEILEERLRLVEAELRREAERADVAEAKLKVAIAPPPPPPPPPLPQAQSQPPVVPLRVKKMSRSSPPPSSEEHVDKATAAPAAAGVNEDIINQIKGGMFTLRKAKAERREREAPKAVSEMLNILGSLRRTTRNRISLAPASYGDVQL